MLELVIIVALIVLLWGYKQLPDIARSLGQAPNQFASGLDDNQDQ